MTWHLGPLLAFDVESTGVDVESDRVVTAALVWLGDGVPSSMSYLIDPGVDIPEAASAVHGITTEQARRDGGDPARLLDEIAGRLAAAINAGTPIVTMNGAFDFTILDRDCRRHGVKPLVDRVREIAPVIDALVLDKAVNRFRPGKRKLENLCETYGVKHDGAHEATADAMAAARVVWAIGNRTQMDRVALEGIYGARKYPGEIARAFHALGRLSVGELHEKQQRWYAEQQESFAQYLRRELNELRHRAERGSDEDRAVAGQEAKELEARIDAMDGSWPMRPFGGAA